MNWFYVCLPSAVMILLLSLFLRFAPKRKPSHDWEAIAGRLYDDLTVAIEEYKTSAMREYEEAAKHD